MELNKNKAVIALSGGVDSAVASALLKDQGMDVTAVTIEPFDLGKYFINLKGVECRANTNMSDAEEVCRQLGIEHRKVDFTDTFKENVINHFISEYLKGETPNPCVRCNPVVKWGEILKIADELGAYYFATGHYANTIKKENTDGSMTYYISQGTDKHKDQSYFLWNLNQGQIARTLFPLGKFSKEKTRELASDYGLKPPDKKDSQEICFIDDSYQSFLRRTVADIDRKIGKGEIIFKGKVIGRHNGYPFYTIGQRKGLGISFERPLYVKKINPENNSIEVGFEEDLYNMSLLAHSVNINTPEDLGFPQKFKVKIRYNHGGAEAFCHIRHDGRLQVDFTESIKSITPGQSVVLYDDDVMIGGGIIDRWM